MRMYVDGITPSVLRDFHSQNEPRERTSATYVHGESGSVVIRRGGAHPVRYQDGLIETALIRGKRALVDHGKIVYGKAQSQIPHPGTEERLDRRVYGRDCGGARFVTEHVEGRCIDCYFEAPGRTRDQLVEGVATLINELNFCGN
jgi:hypothetical protein